jgi:hypothetical protein
VVWSIQEDEKEGCGEGGGREREQVAAATEFPTAKKKKNY